jgi:hypothetical protein
VLRRALARLDERDDVLAVERDPTTLVGDRMVGRDWADDFLSPSLLRHLH